VTDTQETPELTAATAVGLRWITFARVITETLLLASMVVLARLIPPSAFGMFAIAVIVQELAINVPSEGVGSALVQRATVQREHLQGGLALSLALGTALAAVTLVLATVLVVPVFGAQTATLVAMTSPWFLLGAVLALPMAVLRRRLDFRRLSMLGLIQSLVRAASAVLLAAVFGLDASALVLAGLAGLCAMVAFALVFAPVPLPRWRSQAVRDLLPYGGPASIACFAWTGFRNGDYAIVGARLGAAPAGIYWRGFQLAVDYQSKVSLVMNEVAFPVLARTSGADAMFALRRRMVRLVTLAVFPILSLLVVLAPVVVPWLFGAAWAPAVVPTQILAGAGAATVVINAAGTVLMASGRSRAMLGYGVAHFMVYVSAILVASSYGLVAVCIASVSSHVVFVVVAYVVLLHGRDEGTLRCLWDDVAAAAVSSFALLAVSWPLALALGSAGAPPVLDVLLVAGVGWSAYLAVVRLWFPTAWRDVSAVCRRVIPMRRLGAVIRRVPASRPLSS
jgi:O-antigen/teichoic acid export membrane protein